jgi:hypothetical protein
MVLKKKYQRGNQKRKSRVRQYNGIKEKVPEEVMRSRKSRGRQYNGIKEKIPKR